jgi:hypothetical protein
MWDSFEPSCNLKLVTGSDGINRNSNETNKIWHNHYSEELLKVVHQQKVTTDKMNEDPYKSLAKKWIPGTHVEHEVQHNEI